MKQARTFWTSVVERSGTLPCIYSGQNIGIKDFSLDHFLPWRFVTHDLLWNIIPTSKNVNSAKNDSLPNMAFYFDSFAQIQYKAVQTIAASPKTYLLEDYIILFKTSSITEIQNLSFTRFRETLHATIAPQIQIATNMGFTGQWSYIKNEFLDI